LETLDNLRLAASEDLDWNCWGGGGAISRESKQALFCGGGVDGMWNGTTVGSLYTASRVQYSIDLIEIEMINKKIISYYFVIDKSRQRLGKG
jgi:hypothetical protein